MAYKANQEIRLLAADAVKLRRRAGDGLVLHIVDCKAGVEEHLSVQVHAPFPLTAPGRYVAFCDQEDQQIGLLEDIRQLDPESRSLVEEALQFRYFLPKITQILSVAWDNGIIKWKVVTDRGPHTFEVLSRYDVRALGANRFLVRDIDGNRYDIPDVAALDVKSQALLEQSS